VEVVGINRIEYTDCIMHETFNATEFSEQYLRRNPASASYCL